MDLSVEIRDGTVVATLPAGVLDTSSVPVLSQKLSPFLEGAQRMVLDLHHLDFMDSSGLGALVGYRERLHAAGGHLCLAAVPPRIFKLLKMVKMDQVFGIYESVEDAIKAAHK